MKPGKSRVSWIHQTTQARWLSLLKRERQGFGEDNNNGIAKAAVMEEIVLIHIFFST